MSAESERLTVETEALQTTAEQRELWRKEAAPVGRSLIDDVDTLCARLAASEAARAEAVREAVEVVSLFIHYEEWMDRWPDAVEVSTFKRHTFGDLRTARTFLTKHQGG